MKIKSKYFLGILVLLSCLVSPSVFAYNPKVGTPNVSIGKVVMKGTITAVNTDSYTVDVKEGGVIVSKEVKFDKDTRFQIKKIRDIKNIQKAKPVKNQKSIKQPKKISKDLKIGDIVLIKGNLLASGSILATSIRDIPTLKKLKVNNTKIN